MAFILPLQASIGETFDQSYVRIDAVSGSKDVMDIAISYYVSREAADNGRPYVQQDRLSFHPSVSENAPNFIKQGYEYLKTLPEFSEAVDA